MKVSSQIVLPVSPSKAWDVLIDWQNQAKWMKDADSVLVVSQIREGVGTTVSVKTKVLGVPIFSERLEVIAWEPPALLLMAHRSFIKGTGRWSLEPATSGALFTWTEEVQLPIPALGTLALQIYRPVMRRLMRASLKELLRYVIHSGS